MKHKTQLFLIKSGALIVSTYHMFSVFKLTNMSMFALIGALTIAGGEYVLSRDYATGNRRKRSRLIMYALILFSGISIIGNIHAHAVQVEWGFLTGAEVVKESFLILVYSVTLPLIVVAVSFIPVREEEPAESQGQEPETEKLTEAESEREIRVVYGSSVDRGRIDKRRRIRKGA